MAAREKRLLLSLAPDEERLIKKAAKLDALPVATWIRRAAVLTARVKLAG